MFPKKREIDELRSISKNSQICKPAIKKVIGKFHDLKKTPFLFVIFHEIIRTYSQRSIYNTIQTYFEKTNKL